MQRKLCSRRRSVDFPVRTRDLLGVIAMRLIAPADGQGASL
jgi:hypothetical protein